MMDPIDGAGAFRAAGKTDYEAFKKEIGIEVVDHWVQLEIQAPPLGDRPVPVPRPSLDEGPHLSYAFQWFFFSFGTVVAYALIIRKRRSEFEIGE